MNQNPNLLIIVVDQQRYDCIGFSNDYPVQTPNIDRLASEGVSFSNAYAHLPVCCPARQSFLNGRRPEVIGGLWNYHNGLKIPALEPSEYSWVRELKKRNYQTGHIGKWGIHPKYDPTFYGYDQFIDEKQYGQFQKKIYPNITFSQSYFGENNPIPIEDSSTHWTAKKTIEMIEDFSKQSDPWHIRVNFSEPHLPCRPSQPFSDMYDPEDIPVWRNFYDDFNNKPYIQKQQLYNWEIEDYTWEDWAPIVARYYGIISQTDDAIGRMISALEQLGISENTIVIFTSDHGVMCGGHRMMDKHYVLYDDIIKVPLVIRWPKRISSGQQCDYFVYNFLDLPPTILEWLNIEIPAFFNGQSLAGLLGMKKGVEWRSEVVATYNGQQFGLYTQRMIRNQYWKYIWNTTDIDELYHLEKDPNELVNRIDDPSFTSVLQELRKKLYWELYNQGDGLVDNEWMRSQLLKGNKL